MAMACMCEHAGRVGLQATSSEHKYLLGGMITLPDRYLTYYLHIDVPGTSIRDCVQSRTTALDRVVMSRLRLETYIRR